MLSILFTRPVIPLDNNSFTRFLPSLVGFMVYLAILSMSISFIAGTAGNKWTAGITKNLSVQILHNDSFSEKDRADILDRATIMIAQVEGVKYARALSRQELTDLLVPWLGGGIKYTNLPIPDMIDVELEQNESIEIEDLKDSLFEVTENVVIDDHQVWRQKVQNIVGSVQAVIFVLTALIFSSAVFMVIAATRGLMTMNTVTLHMLIIMGATDKFIARDFCRHAFRLGLSGSISGFVFGAITIISLWLIGGGDATPLTLQQWFILLCSIPTTAFISMFGAFLTVKATLNKRFQGIE